MSKEARKVLYVHGWRGGTDIFQKLIGKLGEAGYTAETVTYPSGKFSAEEIVTKYILPFFEKHRDADIVAHSAGGLLTRLAADMCPGIMKNRKVLLVAPAVGGTPLADVQRYMNRTRFMPKMYDPMLVDLSLNAVPKKAIKEATHVGVMAGTGLGRPGKKTKLVHRITRLFLNLTRGANDGTLGLRDIVVPGAKHKVMPLGHTGLLRTDEGSDVAFNFITKGYLD